ncbi:MAG: hypothetical protein OEZ14_08035 [Acidimicrobiia bacterium]|nr:hypothetical protein [Acidimicrobiia bacterium]MDH5520467.1 hypothetical protein [Acidimicrobiia bacterium]
MSTSDGNSTTRPLRRRQSKRFDRSGAPPATGSTMIETDDDDDDDVEVDLPEPGHDESVGDAAAAVSDIDQTQQPDPDPADGLTGAITTPLSTTAATPAPTPAPADEVQSRRTDAPARSRTLDEMTPCGRCGQDVSTVHIEVDGNVLMMESCDNCDTRRWQLAGEPIELQHALDHVGEHTGRRR